MNCQIPHSFTLINKAIALTFVLWVSCLAGCTLRGGFMGVDRCIDCERGEVPEPAGNKMTEWQTAQAELALQDQTTLYKADFIGKSLKFAPAALEKVYRAIESGIENRLWIVEPSGDAATDQARVARVQELLEVNGVENPSVLLAIPRAIGLPGPIAEATIGRAGFGNSGFGNSGFGRSRASQGIQQTRGLGF